MKKASTGKKAKIKGSSLLSFGDDIDSGAGDESSKAEFQVP